MNIDDIKDERFPMKFETLELKKEFYKYCEKECKSKNKVINKLVKDLLQSIANNNQKSDK